jgi:nucleoid DNA-binding protein
LRRLPLIGLATSQGEPQARFISGIAARLLVGYDAGQRTTDFSLFGRGWFVTKKELAKAISEELGITSGVALQAVQRVFDGITETLVEQGRIELRNFGVFEVRKRKPRKARNPRTGENVKVPAKMVVTFKPGREMEERVGRLTIVPGKDQ